MAVKHVDDQLSERLAERGLRFTSQREQVFKILRQERDHPTAEQVYLRAKQDMPDISIATVYNCLDALVQCQLVKQVKLDGGAARYCPNMREHYHFHCTHCSEVYDIDLPEKQGKSPLALPEGFQPAAYEIAVRGLCPKCSGTSSPKS